MEGYSWTRMLSRIHYDYPESIYGCHMVQNVSHFIMHTYMEPKPHNGCFIQNFAKGFVNNYGQGCR